MKAWRALAFVLIVGGLGAAGSLLVGWFSGMSGSELVHLAAALVPALLVTALAMAIADTLLMRSSLRQRLVAVAVVAVAVGLANLYAFARAMFVSTHDASLLGVVLVYALGAGVGAAWVLARRTDDGLRRIGEVTRRLADGDLDARVGRLDAGPELDELANTLDETAARLRTALTAERAVETTRRDLMAAVSHDLRTPLAGLLAMAEAIEDGVVDDPPSMRRYAGEMRRAASALTVMVDDLFELAQIEAGAIAAETRRARLGDVVRSALAAVEPEASIKGLRLRADLAGSADLPCSPRIARVLQTLLVNAVRHTPADGTVTVQAQPLPGEVGLAVRDTGTGIPAEDLERVFEPFYRGDTARTAPGGGLGLALARRIVESLGGSISAANQAERGARFDIRIPIHPAG